MRYPSDGGVDIASIVGVSMKVVYGAVFVLIQSNQKQPSCKKRCGPQKGHGEKRCEIQGGGQEMAVMVG